MGICEGEWDKEELQSLSGKYVFLLKTDEAQVLQNYEANRVKQYTQYLS